MKEKSEIMIDWNLIAKYLAGETSSDEKE